MYDFRFINELYFDKRIYIYTDALLKKFSYHSKLILNNK